MYLTQSAFLCEEPRILELILKNQMKWSHVLLMVILLLLLLRSKLNLCMVILTLQTMANLFANAPEMLAGTSQQSISWIWLVLVVMTRGTKNRYETSCLSHRGVGSVERKLLLLYLPQGDIGQVAGIRPGMFLPHIAVGTEALHLDLSLAQSLNSVIGPQRMVPGRSSSMTVLVCGFPGVSPMYHFSDGLPLPNILLI